MANLMTVPTTAMQPTESGLLMPVERGNMPVYLGPGEIPVQGAERAYACDRDKLAQWRMECRYSMHWRRDSATAIDYWDGNQFSAELMQAFRERGLPPLAYNLIKRWINSVVGMLERNQTDGVVKVDDNKLEALGQALSQDLKEAERMTLADRACLDAADYAIKGGIGWVEVGTESDPFRYPDKVSSINWREIYWDRSAQRADLDDAWWFLRPMTTKRDNLIAALPMFAEQIKLAGTEYDIIQWQEPERLERDFHSTRDPSRWTGWAQPFDMVTITELRYRVMVRGYIVRTPGGPVIFDEANQQHLQAYHQGLVQPEPATYRRVRQAYWLGPHCLIDRWCPVPGNEVGWVPFVCYLEDKTGAPYGLIRDMITMQDEINATKAKMHWSMDSSTLIGDHDRVLNWDDAREAVNRRDGIIKLNGNKPSGTFQIDRHNGITQWQLEAHRDAVNSIGKVHGLDDPLVGTPSSAGQSGKSMQIQIDQSVTALGKPLAHIREARRKVLDLLLAQRIERMGQEPQTLRYQDPTGKQSSVTVNVPIQLEDGSEQMLTLQTIQKKVVLDDTPSTPTYRAQQFLQIVDTLRSMPPEAQKLLIPAMFEMSDLPNRQMYADMARKMLGLGGNMTPEEEAAAAKDAERMERAKDAEVALAEVKAELEAQKAGQAAAQSEVLMATMQKILAEVEQLKQTTALKAEAAAAGHNPEAPKPPPQNNPQGQKRPAIW